jgi:hypothetical protein
MALSRKTWLWILAAVVGFGVVCVVALAGFGMYFIANNVKFEKSTPTDAGTAFDDARTRFKSEGPLFELDANEQPRQLRNLAELPTSSIKTDHLWIMAWDPKDEQIVRVSLPFWMLRFGRQKVDIGGGGFDFQRLQIDLNDLRRVGPVLVLDYRSGGGERVMVWTE